MFELEAQPSPPTTFSDSEDSCRPQAPHTRSGPSELSGKVAAMIMLVSSVNKNDGALERNSR